MIKGIRHVALLSVIICSGAVAQDSDSVCGEVVYGKKLFNVTVQVKGPRGSLTFPAIIDTGASRTLVPSSIMEGIGYSSLGQEEFSTASGAESFDSGVVESLSFLGIKFRNITVFVDNPPESEDPRRFKPRDKKPKQVQDESGIVGMSELSNTSFEHKDGVLRICGKREQ